MASEENGPGSCKSRKKHNACTNIANIYRSYIFCYGAWNTVRMAWLYIGDQKVAKIGR